jgi:radical S-adenosyl methionine domain-containing protein 2
MQNSYLILDEKMRFLNCTGHAKQPSDSILEVGVVKALSQSGFDEEMFKDRGGIYDWRRTLDGASIPSTICSNGKDISW